MKLVPLVIIVSCALGGCGKSIGDPCSTNPDCSPLGDRFCDTASIGGYCTLEGCDSTTCPSEAVCIRFFSTALNRPCQTDRSFPGNGCTIDERCVCDMTDANNSCQANAGHCASETSERRWCQKTCNSSRDCRTGYECRSTGTSGAEPVPDNMTGMSTAAKFCAPTGN